MQYCRARKGVSHFSPDSIGCKLRRAVEELLLFRTLRTAGEKATAGIQITSSGFIISTEAYKANNLDDLKEDIKNCHPF